MRKVLVVEDNKDNFKMTNYALTRAGYEVLWAERGEDGVELVNRERPLFILMDINLPGIDGIETTKRIRESEANRDIPIIAITAHAMSGDRERIIAAGCNAYIEKPIDPITIVEQIHKIIGLQADENPDR
ncbi:MAG: response regulator [Desulfuromonadaceae bacterium]|nr:response regulator [Desulfuromonadaceae bacterium]MDD5106442.1 response regulator [Desulfuromonadaceae bacterium]